MTKPIVQDGWQLVGHDPELRRSLWATLDENLEWVFRVDYEVDHLLQANHEENIEQKNKPFQEWHKVASVPVGQYHKDLDEAADQNDDAYIRKYLNDPDNRKFRTFRNRS